MKGSIDQKIQAFKVQGLLREEPGGRTIVGTLMVNSVRAKLETDIVEEVEARRPAESTTDNRIVLVTCTVNPKIV